MKGTSHYFALLTALLLAGCQALHHVDKTGEYYLDGYAGARQTASAYAHETPRQTCYTMLFTAGLLGGGGNHEQKTDALQGCFDYFTEFGKNLDIDDAVDVSSDAYRSGYAAGETLGQPNDSETPDGACERVTGSLGVANTESAIGGCDAALVKTNGYLTPSDTSTTY